MLADGSRLSKNHPVFEALGTLDELNSHLGYCVSLVADEEIEEELKNVQHYLLTLGGFIAKSPKISLQLSAVSDLEKLIDKYQQKFGDDWHKRFLLPGGIELAARLDVARAVCRRLERKLISYNSDDDHDLTTPRKYINRLSDYLFALRCWVNEQAGYNEKQFVIDR